MRAQKENTSLGFPMSLLNLAVRLTTPPYHGHIVTASNRQRHGALQPTPGAMSIVSLVRQ